MTDCLFWIVESSSTSSMKQPDSEDTYGIFHVSTVLVVYQIKISLLIQHFTPDQKNQLF